MFESVVPINKERHGQKRVRNTNDFGFASSFHVASITLHEMARAAAIYPVVFLEDTDKDSFRPVVLLGLEAGENLFLNEEGKWDASYIPAIIRRYPFALAKGGDDRYVVCVDEASDLLSDDEGQLLFDEEGNATQVVENVRRYLGELQMLDQVTQEFTAFLTENNMFTPLNMRVNAKEGVRSISGCYVINEERLNNLTEEKFMTLRSKGFLPGIYGHLISLAQIERLISMKKGSADPQVNDVADQGLTA
ncbi:SapC family protein [Magnetococcus sp. PR-3]|uniref:SapC family protein n=1 Tax=Magnetococcus sp. PR-3 TaxID=3120355 RepID=UPI002FCE51A7